LRETIEDVLFEGKKKLKGVPFDQDHPRQPELGVDEQHQAEDRG
jgi:hypothetical protein